MRLSQTHAEIEEVKRRRGGREEKERERERERERTRELDRDGEEERQRGRDREESVSAGVPHRLDQGTEPEPAKKKMLITRRSPVLSTKPNTKKSSSEYCPD